MVLRWPDSPAYAGANELIAAGPLAKIFGVPVLKKTPVFTGPIWSAFPSISKFVGKLLNPLSTVTGKPLVRRNKPESCQPPMKASTNRFVSFPNARPRPNGNSKIQLELNWCVASKDDTPFCAFGFHALIMLLFNPSNLPLLAGPTRSASEEMSIDFENV